ncbi:hypothetical protein Nepgr_002312 [Nepenthes gracilis]|uniref:WRKY domain-containing protein n=1 Tax=Nepenthes gracilis TaxID=150966 RepID=A0AAD3P8M6_NEPGR|nr:hypothetical protein Nepgr_002312 [Nepenthes gracilis]
MEADWDLQAVIRGFTNASSSGTPVADTTSIAAADLHRQPCFSSFGPKESGTLFRFPDSFETISNSSSGGEELLNLYKPFSLNMQSLPSQNNPIPTVLSSAFAGFREQPQQSPQLLFQQQPPVNQSQIAFGTDNTSISWSTFTPQYRRDAGTSAGANPQSQRTKKRKNLPKKVCHVPAQGLSSDTWAWRKYGQKPIKGSPYPRGYYRCSSSKGCLARKQVERNRSDPKMFIVTYTEEHNHPMPNCQNSIAGNTRQ